MSELLFPPLPITAKVSVRHCEFRETGIALAVLLGTPAIVVPTVTVLVDGPVIVNARNASRS